jgi:hypothetical protein
MKCFKGLVMAHIKPSSQKPGPTPNHRNRSTDTLHTALSHLDKRNTYVSMLFIDYSSAFNTIVSSKLITKLRTLRLNTSLCNWILDFLMGRPQVVKVSNNISATLTFNTGASRGCVLSPLQYSLFTHDCMATHDSKHHY